MINMIVELSPSEGGPYALDYSTPPAQKLSTEQDDSERTTSLKSKSYPLPKKITERKRKKHSLLGSVNPLPYLYSTRTSSLAAPSKSPQAASLRPSIRPRATQLMLKYRLVNVGHVVNRPMWDTKPNQAKPTFYAKNPRRLFLAGRDKKAW
ncbi:hypothetical protein B9Z19DRAFT_600195 [Tuber borchii]|uniref:Uncharacterized protein n=1 Tax=Tuber borchii TaxID=42251 RepID=A0A2T6ZBT3_TUBBO|nr:hypothetical protein B9Z19DRAFT_600195 [Tuber borchii]